MGFRGQKSGLIEVMLRGRVRPTHRRGWKFGRAGQSAMTESTTVYEFGDFRLDTNAQTLARQGESVAITPKVFETLLILVRRSGEVVTKDELMKELWPDSFVEESNLSQNIFMLRKALGDSGDQRRYIITVPGRGYRFAHGIRRVSAEEELIVVSTQTRSEIVIEEEEVDRGAVRGFIEGGDRKTLRLRWLQAAAIVSVLVLAGIAGLAWKRLQKRAVLGNADSVLVTDFVNTTGEPVFDDTLRQGLLVQLEQSPFLRLIPDDRVQHTLQLMGRAASGKITPDMGREVCQRAGGAAELSGSIATLGSSYVIGLKATDCKSGVVLDEEQAQAAHKEDVLRALSEIASRFRKRVGETLSTIQEHDTPLAEATTPSLEALKTYSMGQKVLLSEGAAAALPFFQKAVAIDPKFAMANALLGRAYGDLGEATQSTESTQKAYAFRERTSDAEKFWITASYQMQVTENLAEAQRTCEMWERTYPRDPIPRAFLAGIIYPLFGKYEQSIAEAKEAIRLNPDFEIPYYLLAARYQQSERLNEVDRVLEEASAQRVEIPELLMERFDLAFERGSWPEMERIATAARGRGPAEEWITQHHSLAMAYTGRVNEARKGVLQAENLARDGAHPEVAALYQAGHAIWESRFGNDAAARREAEDALGRSKDRGVLYGSALGLAIAGDAGRAGKLADELEKDFPEGTAVSCSYLPTLRAQIALGEGKPAKAIEDLEVTRGCEFGLSRAALHGYFGAMYPAYLRGESYLALHKGAEAAAEFQKILDHPGIVMSDPVGALAHLEKGRSLAMAGDRDKARTAYQKFLSLWKSADPDVPILQQARKEFAALARHE